MINSSQLCPNEEKGCSAWDLVIIDSCRVGNLLSNYILTELHIPEHTIGGTHRNRKMPNYSLFIDILGGNL